MDINTSNDDTVPRVTADLRKSTELRSSLSPSPSHNNTKASTISLRRNSSFNNLTTSQLSSNSFQLRTLLTQIASSMNFPTNPKNNCGSLYKLFESEYFSIQLLIYYLFEKDTLGISDFLVNVIRSKYINQTFFYIPQLVDLIAIKTNNESLEEFILDCCVDKIKFSLIVTWMITSNIFKACNDEYKDKFAKINNNIETTLVNTKRQNIFFSNVNNSSLYKNVTDKSDINEIYKRCVNKEYQIRYFEQNVKVYNNLKLLCEKLKSIDNTNECLVELKHFLQNSNKKIKKLYDTAEEIKNSINTSTKNLFRGIILPFDDSDSVNDKENNLIVNFVPEYSTCLKTKARVPVKLVVECVRAYECENWDNLYQVNTANNDFTITSSMINDTSLCDEKNYQFNPFNEKWSYIASIVKSQSAFKNFKSYSVKSFIFKTNDDLSQEAMIMQLIKLFNKIFIQSGIRLKLFPYDIVITSQNSGLIEYIPNSVSIDFLKKKILSSMDLNDFFRNFFCNNFEEAQKNFVESLAGYSLITYLINIKDRHNGNILLDINGNVIHIDFGFVLGISPGSLGFENAPFKLTQEYIDIMDGKDSSMFLYYKSLILRGLIEVRKYVDDFMKIIEIRGKSVKMPCFNGRSKKEILDKFRERFCLGKSEVECVKIVDDLVEKSINNWRTTQYDNFQQLSNGIRP